MADETGPKLDTFKSHTKNFAADRSCSLNSPHISITWQQHYKLLRSQGQSSMSQYDVTYQLIKLYIGKSTFVKLYLIILKIT